LIIGAAIEAYRPIGDCSDSRWRLRGQGDDTESQCEGEKALMKRDKDAVCLDQCSIKSSVAIYKHRPEAWKYSPYHSTASYPYLTIPDPSVEDNSTNSEHGTGTTNRRNRETRRKADDKDTQILRDDHDQPCKH